MIRAMRTTVLIISLMVTQIMGAGFHTADCTVTEIPLITAFKAAGCNVVSAKIDIWSSIGEHFLELEELKEKALKTAKILEMPSEDLEIMEEYDNGYRLVKASGFLKEDIYIEIFLHSLQFPEELNIKPETFILINSVEKEGFTETRMLSERLKNAVAEFEGIPQIYSCITGVKSGKLNDSAIEQSINDIFESVSANRVENTIDPVLTNAYGYSPLIEDYITVMGYKINLNVAARYSEYDDMTYFWVGSPIISGDY